MFDKFSTNTKMITRTILFVYLLSVFVNVESLKILAIFPYTGKSHHYVIDPLLNTLAEKGHEVTVISHFSPKHELKTRKDIVLGSGAHQSEEVIVLKDFEHIPKFLSMLQVAAESIFLYDNGKENCESLLSNKEVKKLVKDLPKYDVALVEQFNSDCLLGIVHKFGIPAVGLTSDIFLPWHFDRFGALYNPSFVPCHNLGYGTKPKFFEVLLSWTVCSLMKLGYYYRSTLPTQQMLSEYLGEEIPPLDELAKKISMVMTNSYFPLHGAFPLAPNIVEVGGLYLKNSSQLPEDLQTFIDDSPQGVIYFSFGSMIKANSISPEKLKDFQDAFAELPQKVLWKWENDTMLNKPKNVLIRKWFPQFDILNHENVRAFITHGGMLSTTEAISCGVPIVSIPLFGDQFANSAAAEENGLGTTLHFRDTTKENILSALKKVLNPNFHKAVKKLSAVWADRPLPPLETAVYWIEHVARHGGQHLRPASADLPLYRYLLLDVIAFIFVTGFILAFISYYILKTVFRLICKPNFKSKKD